MPDQCTCGAQLPPDALFCHKCGRPQREYLVEPEVEIAPAPPPVPDVVAQVAPPGPSFGNPAALKSALAAAALATLLNLILPYGFVVWLVAAGFLSVYLFSRRTRQFLTVRGGLRMGWITGMVSFVLLAGLFLYSLVALSRQAGGLSGFLREQKGALMDRDPNLEQAVKILETPAGQIATLLGMFGMVTVFCTLGGAIGAKVLEKEGS